MGRGDYSGNSTTHHQDLAAHTTKVLVVGQTPPPFHGQAIATQQFLQGEYDTLELIPVRMAYSRTIDEVSRFSFRKAVHLIGLVLRVGFYRFFRRVRTLYYLPSGGRRISMYRDIVFLSLARLIFPRTVFHFQSAGIADLHSRLTAVERLVFRLAYDRPDLAIQLSVATEADARVMRARQVVTVPNPAEPVPEAGSHVPFGEPGQCRFLYVGTVSETKGVMDLLEAFGTLAPKYRGASLTVVGPFRHEAFRHRTEEFVASAGLGDRVRFTGPLFGHEKWGRFREADALCFPSYFENESFGIVMVEAMQFNLPVVASRWRAAVEVVQNGETGYLARVRDPADLAEKLEHVILDPERAREMGRRGREVYEARYTLERFRVNMEKAIRLLPNE